MASAKVVPPGEESKIEVTLNTHDRHGHQSKNVVVYTNDPENRRVTLNFTVEIDIAFGFESNKIDFGRFDKRTELPVKTLHSQGEFLSSVKIKSIAVKNEDHKDYYVIELLDSGPGPNRTIDLKVTATKRIPVGRFSDLLVVSTDLESTQDLELFMHGEILGPIVFRPKTLFLKSNNPNQPFSGRVNLQCIEKHAFRVLRAESDNPKMTFVISEPTVKGEVTIKASLPSDYSEERYNGLIKVITNLADQDEFYIPVYKNPRVTR